MDGRTLDQWGRARRLEFQGNNGVARLGGGKRRDCRRGGAARELQSEMQIIKLRQYRIIDLIFPRKKDFILMWNEIGGYVGI